jgi:hypothetical protein
MFAHKIHHGMYIRIRQDLPDNQDISALSQFLPETEKNPCNPVNPGAPGKA